MLFAHAVCTDRKLKLGRSGGEVRRYVRRRFGHELASQCLRTAIRLGWAVRVECALSGWRRPTGIVRSRRSGRSEVQKGQLAVQAFVPTRDLIPSRQPSRALWRARGTDRATRRRDSQRASIKAGRNVAQLVLTWTRKTATRMFSIGRRHAGGCAE
jgi:hypothetical protein